MRKEKQPMPFFFKVVIIFGIFLLISLVFSHFSNNPEQVGIRIGRISFILLLFYFGYAFGKKLLKK